MSLSIEEVSDLDPVKFDTTEDGAIIVEAVTVQSERNRLYLCQLENQSYGLRKCSEFASESNSEELDCVPSSEIFGDLPKKLYCTKEEANETKLNSFCQLQGGKVMARECYPTTPPLEADTNTELLNCTNFNSASTSELSCLIEDVDDMMMVELEKMLPKNVEQLTCFSDEGGVQKRKCLPENETTVEDFDVESLKCLDANGDVPFSATSAPPERKCLVLGRRLLSPEVRALVRKVVEAAVIKVASTESTQGEDRISDEETSR